jgi:hypothetical protein
VKENDHGNRRRDSQGLLENLRYTGNYATDLVQGYRRVGLEQLAIQSAEHTNVVVRPRGRANNASVFINRFQELANDQGNGLNPLDFLLANTCEPLSKAIGKEEVSNKPELAGTLASSCAFHPIAIWQPCYPVPVRIPGRSLSYFDVVFLNLQEL